MKDLNFPKFEPIHKINEEEALRRIDIICKYKNYRFDGFVGDKWNGIYTKLKLHCNICGNNWDSCNYNNFKSNKGCTQCAKNNTSKRSTYKLEDALININKICEEKNYRFDGFVGDEWKGTSTKLKLHCNVCNYDWESTTYCSFSRNHGCPQCGGRLKPTNEKVLETINKICEERNYRFDGFIGGEYKNKYTYLKLHCNICGNDWESCSYDNFVKFHRGCPACKGGIRLTEDYAIKQVIEACNKKNCVFHGFVGGKYTNNTVKLQLECKKCGFFWESTDYNNFVNDKTSCPKCNISHLENEIKNLLEKNNINYVFQQTFDWLVNVGKLKLDYYIPSKNIAIECQGVQHFKEGHWGGAKQLKLNQERDTIKRKLCEEHGIKLLYYSNLHIDYPYEVIEDEDELLNKILE